MLVTGMALSYRRIAVEIEVNLLRFLIPPALVAGILLAGYWWLNRHTGLTDVRLTMRLACKGVYAVGGFALLTILVEPRATRERLAYVARLVRQR
jgi:hypothetical protein